MISLVKPTALNLYALTKWANILRVHDIREHKNILKLYDLIEQWKIILLLLFLIILNFASAKYIYYY